jgi:hypothetical protein
MNGVYNCYGQCDEREARWKALQDQNIEQTVRRLRFKKLQEERSAEIQFGLLMYHLDYLGTQYQFTQIFRDAAATIRALCNGAVDLKHRNRDLMQENTDLKNKMNDLEKENRNLKAIIYIN